MKLFIMEGVCLTRRKETYACSSLGFRNENTNTSVNTNCKKGGPVCL
jgi:hypothetical protein